MTGKRKTPSRRSTMKRLRMPTEEESFTSPSVKKPEDNLNSLLGQKNSPVIVEDSSSQQEKDEWNPSVTAKSKGLMSRITVLEHGFNHMKNSHETLKQLILKSITKKDSYGGPNPSLPETFKKHSTPHNSDLTDMNPTERVMKKLQKQEDKDYPIVKKLFSPTKKQNYLSSMFKPQKPLHLRFEEVAVATYIFFHETLDEDLEKEVLISTETNYCQETRKLFQCLKPKQMLEEDVINLVSSVLTVKEREAFREPDLWFMPTTFSQFVLSWNMPTLGMITHFQKRFMGKADMMSKVFIPVHDQEYQHWFLLVVDFIGREVVYLDSLPQTSAFPGRMRSVKKLTLYIEELLLHPSFYDVDISKRPSVSLFNLKIKEGLGVQREDSNDCGIWVISWMLQKGLDEYKIEVDEGTRLGIALELACSSYNNSGALVSARAKDFMEANYNTLKG
ncbi:Ulp1 protease family, C-terminal catalytic domain [Sesbania bispinosa]|nr:Ulp1 protease family, C-terminal catalytic domain [Sesbania bispinosa]